MLYYHDYTRGVTIGLIINSQVLMLIQRPVMSTSLMAKLLRETLASRYSHMMVNSYASGDCTEPNRTMKSYHYRIACGSRMMVLFTCAIGKATASKYSIVRVRSFEILTFPGRRTPLKKIAALKHGALLSSLRSLRILSNATCSLSIRTACW